MLYPVYHTHTTISHNWQLKMVQALLYPTMPCYTSILDTFGRPRWPRHLFHASLAAFPASAAEPAPAPRISWAVPPARGAAAGNVLGLRLPRAVETVEEEVILETWRFEIKRLQVIVFIGYNNTWTIFNWLGKYLIYIFICPINHRQGGNDRFWRAFVMIRGIQVTYLVKQCHKPSVWSDGWENHQKDGKSLGMVYMLLLYYHDKQWLRDLHKVMIIYTKWW